MSALFGPGGNSQLFHNLGHTATVDAPTYVKEMGLDLYEYEAGNGIASSPAVLTAIGQEAKKNDIKLTFHAPYFISLSGVDIEKRLNSIRYIRESLDAARLLGSDIIVVHTGSCAKISRDEAMRLAADTLVKTLSSVDTHGVRIGLETMGKLNQLGTLEEVVELCRIDKSLVPVVDFGHLNARNLGGYFNTADDYLRIFDKIDRTLGFDVANNLHCHFSKIEWTASGEKRHLTFEDTEYGPDYRPLIDVISKHRLSPTIISESAGTQDIDAKEMKEYYRSLNNDKT